MRLNLSGLEGLLQKSAFIVWMKALKIKSFDLVAG
jgi:hypothetical protein